MVKRRRGSTDMDCAIVHPSLVRRDRRRARFRESAMTIFCAIDALVIESLRSILGKNLVVFLRRLGAAADIHRILRREANVGAKLYHQFIAALDGDNGTAGFDTNIR